MSNKYYIWWLDQHDCEVIDRIYPELPLPEYIADQFYSRYGRAGRGRLWVPSDIPVDSIKWKETPLTEYFAENSGGIVFHARDLQRVNHLPGFVTDLNLELTASDELVGGEVER